MARYKGQHTRKHVEVELPHWVEIQNPDGGWWKIHSAIENWHRARGLMTKDGAGDQWHRRFCFEEPATADAFQAEFGGTRKDFQPKQSKKRAG